MSKPKITTRNLMSNRSDALASGVPVTKVKTRGQSKQKQTVKETSMSSTITYGQRKVKMQNRRSKLRANRPQDSSSRLDKVSTKRSMKARKVSNLNTTNEHTESFQKLSRSSLRFKGLDKSGTGTSSQLFASSRLTGAHLALCR